MNGHWGAGRGRRVGVRARERGGRGFSLPEILIAFAVAGLMVAAFGACFPTASRAVTWSRHRDGAADACQQQLEAARNAGYGAVTGFGSGSTVTQSFTPPSYLPRATGTVKFTRVDGSFNATTADTGRYRVDATCSWNGVTTDQGTITLTTFLLR